MPANAGTPPGTVATAALAAFRAALGDEAAITTAEPARSDATWARDLPPDAPLDLPALPDIETQIDSDHQIDSDLPLDAAGPAEQSDPTSDVGTVDPSPAVGKGRGRLSRLRHRRSERAFLPVDEDLQDRFLDHAAPFSPPATEWSPPVLALEPEPEPGVDVDVEASAPADATDTSGARDAEEPSALQPSAGHPPGTDDRQHGGDQVSVTDDWAPDDSAWAGLAIDDTPPAFGVPVGAFAAPGAIEPETIDLAEEKPVPTAATIGNDNEGDRLGERDARGFLRSRRFAASLSPKLLAVATAGVLAAGIIGAIIVHPKGFPRFETVNIQGARGQSLFPGSTTDPATVPPNRTPLIIIPPGNTVSSPSPGGSTPSSPSSPLSPSSPSSTTAASPGTSATAPRHTPTASGGSSGASGGNSGPSGTSPPTPAPPNNPTTTRPGPTTTAPPTTPPTTPPPSPPTTFCILFICN